MRKLPTDQATVFANYPHCNHPIADIHGCAVPPQSSILQPAKYSCSRFHRRLNWFIKLETLFKPLPESLTWISQSCVGNNAFLARMAMKFWRCFHHPQAAMALLRMTLALLMLFHGWAKIRYGIGSIEQMLQAAGVPGWLGYAVYIG